MSSPRLAIIGAGHLGRIHSRLATELSDVELVAVCDPSETACNEVAAANNITPVADYRDIIPQIDAAIVAAPTSLHCRIGSELASRGIHCFIEKPLAPTVEEAPIHCECRTIGSLEVPPLRKLFIAEVVATTAVEGAVDDAGRLIVPNVPFFGMTAGSGEHYTMGDRIGNIGMTMGRSDIKY